MKILTVDGNEELYLSTMEKWFPRLPQATFIEGFHLAVRENGEYQAGVSLRNLNLNEDDDVMALWRVRDSIPATRLSRFWSQRPENIPRLLHAVLEAHPRDTFFYGMLSISSTNARTLPPSLNILQPHDSTIADLPTSTTSDGPRLLRTYVKIGAKPLGPPALSADGSIKVIFGMEARHAKLDL